MMREEFEKLIQKEIGIEDYAVIEKVYTFHPNTLESDTCRDHVYKQAAPYSLHADAAASSIFAG